MDCIVWAHNIVGDSPSSQASMPEEELRNILSVSLIGEEVDESAQGECSREQSGGLLTEPQSREETSEEDAIEDVGDSDEDETLATLEASLAQCSPGSLRHRQLSLKRIGRKGLKKRAIRRGNTSYKRGVCRWSTCRCSRSVGGARVVAPARP